MMKIADRLCFSTLGCPEWTFEQTLEQAKAMGFAAIEIRGIGAELNTARLPCLLPENRAQTQALLEKHGVRICGLNTSVAFHDPAKREEALSEGEAALGICKEMGIPAIRVFGDAIPKGEATETVTQRVISGLSTLSDQAPEGTKVLLEIHGSFNTVETVAPLLSALGNHPGFGILWDIEHSFHACGNDTGAFYSLIRPYIVHTHIKGCRSLPTGSECCLPGEGDLDAAQLIGWMERDGYQGLYSFEWEKRWHPELAAPEAAFPGFVSFMKGLT